MKKANCFLLTAMLFLAACGGSGGSGSSPSPATLTGTEQITGETAPTNPTSPTTPTTPATPVSDVPKAALTWDAALEFVNVTGAQEDKFLRAIEIIKSVVATEEFRTRILNYTYNGKKEFIDNNGLSNSQIYQIILDGAEKLMPNRNNTMDMTVELYTAATNVVGYTYPNVSKIWVNTKYFNSYTAAGVAHNLMHEWLHKLGFGHDSAATPTRPYSVPYAVGYIVADIGKDFL